MELKVFCYTEPGLSFTLQNWLIQSPLLSLGGGGEDLKSYGQLKFRIDWILFRIAYYWVWNRNLKLAKILFKRRTEQFTDMLI